MIVNHIDKKEIKTTVGLILFSLIKISVPVSVAFLLVWQSVDHAHLNRQIKKLSQQIR